MCKFRSQIVKSVRIHLRKGSLTWVHGTMSESPWKKTWARELELDHCSDPSGTESNNMQLNKTFRGRGSRLSPVPCRSENKIAGTFAQQLGWVFVGPCHPSAHGPPARVEVLHLFRCYTTHTHRSLYTEEFTQRNLHRDPFTWKVFTHRSFYTQTLLHREVFTRRSFYTRRSFTQRSFYTQKLLPTEKLLHTEAFAQRTFAQWSLYTEEAFTQISLHTQEHLHREVFAQRAIYTQTRLHTKAFTQSRGAFTHRSFYTPKLLHREVFQQGSFYTQKSLHREPSPQNVAISQRCLSYDVRPSFRAKGLQLSFQNCNVLPVFDLRP